jgi:hypothetical protein
MALSSPEEVEHWEQMGFEVPAGEDTEPSLVHLNNEGTHPRVVPVEDFAQHRRASRAGPLQSAVHRGRGGGALEQPRDLPPADAGRIPG